MKYSLTALAAAGLTSMANAHMFLAAPVPITGNAIKDPLLADGSNFPCHGVTPPFSGGASMPVGSVQPLVFATGGGANTAVHGGGSCQISITYETDATALADPSNWKVIWSVEEGCPTNSPLNLDGSYTGPGGSTYTGSYLCNDTSTNGFDCVNSFNFTIPSELKNGQATLAWTWFNTVGNREMYMNCAAIDISGGASDTSGMSALPNMFVANIGDISGTCATIGEQNLMFPDPGPVLFTKTPTSRLFVASATSQYTIAYPTGCNSSPTSTYAIMATTPASSAAASSAAALSATSAAAAAPTSASSTTTTKKTSTTKSTTKATMTNTSSTKKTSSTKITSTKKTSSVKASTTVKAANASSATLSATPSSTCAAGSVPCTTYDSIICVDSTHFGICDYNDCAISQSVAAGTMCKNGEITWASKRSLHSRGRRSFHRQALKDF